MENFKGEKKSNNENELNPEISSRFKSPVKKQLPTKNFMNPTISASIKASVPRKKILGERNETLEQTSLRRSSSFGSKPVKSPVLDSDDDVGKPCLQPYDPVTNYLSPRPKFLRYNPNRRRKILNLQESDEGKIKISTYFNVESELGLGSSVPSDSCSHQESIEKVQDMNLEEDEDCEDDDYDDDEFGEDGCCSLKGFLKFLFAVIAVILTAHAICLMNSPSTSQTLGSNHVYGFNLSEVECGLIREPDLLVEYGHSGGLDMSETKEEFVMIQNVKTDDYVILDEVENDDSNVIQDEILQENDDSNVILDEILQEQAYIEAETVDDFNQDHLFQEDDSTDAKEFDDMTSFDPTIVILVGLMLILTTFTSIYFSKWKKSSGSVTPPVQKQEFKNLEPSKDPQQKDEEEEPVVTSASVLVPPPLQNDVSEVNIPSVELLGELVFSEETTSNISTENYSTNSLIQTKSSQDSHTIKTQRGKKTEVVTPSPVRRSSRLKTRSIMSP